MEAYPFYVECLTTVLLFVRISRLSSVMLTYVYLCSVIYIVVQILIIWIREEVGSTPMCQNDWFWITCISWWRHQMETFSALLALCAGNSPVPVNSPHKSQWRGVLMFSLICAWINDWVNNRQAGDLRRHCGHYDVNVMYVPYLSPVLQTVQLSRRLSNFACSFVGTILNRRLLIQQ